MRRFRIDPGFSFASLRQELGVVEAFPAAALAEAARAAQAPLPDRTDETAVPFLTIDPEGSLDLDQAVHLERAGSGFRFRYAIADVGAFVTLGGALDTEARRRGETLYAPDTRIPLHPPVLSEAAASLLPDQVRPALLWDLLLDSSGAPVDVSLRRVLVRSRRQLTYDGVQAALDGGTADEQLLLLREVGLLREALARERGAVDLPSPEQRVEQAADGSTVLTLRAPLPAEGWNAQLSLLTGMVGARMMLDGGIGLLRTMPDFGPDDVAGLRRSALALGVAWPEGASYGQAVSALDPKVPAEAAVVVLATRLLRGAGYTAFDGAPPELTTHSAVAAPYSHVTAPLRRLADRFALEVCVALSADRPVADGVRLALPLLPALMAAAGRRSGELERAGTDLAEALVLAHRVGEHFKAAVVESGPRHGVVQLADPPVRARCEGADLPLGTQLSVVLVTADPATRAVVFRPA
ncbi:MAG: ribonuclease [Frankiales bacterium]|nr:ribonuclease [Frankiales bacterium]